MILAYEASRLARNNTDWYTLLDLATVVGALIADTEGIYDPRDYNDRLLLGLRGLLSEAELHTLRLRMDAGRQRQIEQGRYQQHVPTGLVRLEDGKVSKTPDMQVQRTIELVFTRFEALGSCQKVLRSLRDDGILLPRHQRGGPYAGQVIWRKPTQAALSEILHNPAYAGAFVYGRKGPHPDRRPGQLRQIRRSMEEWTTIHHGVYPAYITWEQFLANQARLADNASDFARRAHGAPRQGSALLAGLVVCGRCGYQMRVTYKPQRRYTCTALAANYGAATCLHVDGASLEAVIVDAFFTALCKERGWLKMRGRQRTDSTHVLAKIRMLNRAECVLETLRHALNVLAVVAPEWLQGQVRPDWLERYGHRSEEYRLPSGADKRQQLLHHVGQDGWNLLAAIESDPQCHWMRSIPAVDTLQRVWKQDYLPRDLGGIWIADENRLPAAKLFFSPHESSCVSGHEALHVLGWIQSPFQRNL